jgi:hypothetical protein
MKVHLALVPPGGGEAEYSLAFDLPEIPRAGDYISVMRDGQAGTEDFVVVRTRWVLNYPKAPAIQDAHDAAVGKLTEIWVECDFAIGHFSSVDHLRTCERFERTGKAPTRHIASAY